jgi:antagonist of KipI
MGLRVLSPGFLTTIQDLGRFDYQRFGVPPSGAMDWFALHAANRLVGNPAGAAGLEFTMQAPDLMAEEDCLVAAAGCGFDLWVAGRWVGLWMAARVRRGELIQFGVRPEGGWGYLAAAGGIDTPMVLGSRSTYVRSGLGGFEGRALRAEDRLLLGAVSVEDSLNRAGAWLAPSARLPYVSQAELAVVPGPQVEAFSSQGQAVFYGSAYLRPHRLPAER